MGITIKKAKSMTIFRSHYLEYRTQQKYNLISCGTPRGGTSVIGILMKLFNFELGDNIHPTVYEDMGFEGVPMQEWGNIVRSRISENENWCLKMPIASKCLEMFEDNLPNPVFFIVIRNPFGVAKSLIRHDPDYIDDIQSYQRGISNALHNYLSFSSSMLRLNSPFIIAEHEKIISIPEVFVNEFVENLNIDTDQATINKAISLISKPGYKRIREPDYEN